MNSVCARELLSESQRLLKQYFQDVITDESYNCEFTDVTFQHIVAIGAFEFVVPAVKECYKVPELASFFDKLKPEYSHLFQVDWEKRNITYYCYKNQAVEEQTLPSRIAELIYTVIKNYRSWAGEMTDNGEHVIDLKNPVPGPHFYTNMLLGNRMRYPYALQTTPKSVVDRFGGGSFRSYAAKQVLATRWDMLPDENGFPCNRQFYLVEEGKQIFYSADVTDSNIKKAICTHSQNKTVIEYETYCGLKIKRTIFLLPQHEGLPVATEVQRVELTNLLHKERTVKIIMTGMFGTAATHALMEDVVYSTVIMQSKVLTDDEGHLLAYLPDYYPVHASMDARFASLMVYQEGNKEYAEELCTNYNEFIGSGNLIKPEGLNHFTNHMSTKGPGFFAMAKTLQLNPEQTVAVDQFVGMISEFKEERVEESLIEQQITALHERFQNEKTLYESLTEQMEGYHKYRTYLQVCSKDERLNTYINENLPFQVLYQTFVSRSFDLTQKGYREIGFREIQDIYASMYYLISMGEIEYTKSLLQEWIEKVFDYGYCYHNFFFEGKEAGKWSDDGLWLVQAVYRYIEYTRDFEFLKTEYQIAGSESKRTVYATLQAIIEYSSEISIGEHGLPLIDYADWNDCLKVDEEYLTGPQKEQMTSPFKGYSESVMNAFLLKTAMNEMEEMAVQIEDEDYAYLVKHQGEELLEAIQTHAWKGDFFARVLFNRYGDKITYLGAAGDGLSGDPSIHGTYFLNSFSWSILSEVATEQQIKIMMERVNQYLKQPYGLRLMSPTDLSGIAKKTATGEYFMGDRENGGIFKHATMMATAAMLKAAKWVEDKELAKQLFDLADWMINLVLPYTTMEHPFVSCGNPRWCTQYINSETGEHIGPTLSGTSTWLTLSIFEVLGITYYKDYIMLDPIIPENAEEFCFSLRYFTSRYDIQIKKSKGFARIKDHPYTIEMDGGKLTNNHICLFDDGIVHKVVLCYE